MEHSKNFGKVKKYYNTVYNGERVWNETRVRKAVEKNWITPNEYEEIVGQAYKA